MTRSVVRTLAAVAGAALTTTLIGSPPGAAAPSTANEAPEQFRGYWVDGFNEGIYDADEVTKLVDAAQDVGANALIVQVGRRFDCFCNDSLYPRSDEKGLEPEPYDPLAEVVAQGHEAGLEVHAWVNATTLWNEADPPKSSDHAFNKHGLDAHGRDRWLNKRVDGEELVGDNSYMDPANPDAVDYQVRAIASLTRNYDVDGVNLDYIRYPDNEAEFQNDWGYSETSLARFAAETGRSDRPKPTDPQFAQWRRDQVSNLVRKIFIRMHQVDRSDRLSINGITYAYGPQTYGGWEQTRPYLNVLQDWKGWIDEGIIDTVTAMNYKREWMPDQEQMFDEWNRALANYRGDRHVVSGPALYLNEIADSVAQAAEIDALPLDGWMGYAYANASKTAAESEDPAVKDSERSKLATALRDEVFTDDAVVPEMDWKAEPRTGNISAKVRAPRRLEDQLDVQVTPLGETPGRAQMVRTDGNGWFGVVDLEPGRYRLKVVEPGVRSRVARVRVRAGAVVRAQLRAQR